MSRKDSSSHPSLATKLLAAQNQLHMYVKDLKMLLAREETKSQQDLRVAYQAEQQKNSRT